MLVVETALADRPIGGGDLRILAEGLWSGRARSISEAQDILQGTWGDLHAEAISHPPTRVKAEVRVDAGLVTFDVLSNLATGWGEQPSEITR